MAKRETHAARRQRLLAEAARVEQPSDCDVTVIGGGAAGLVAAIAAAEDGASVVVIERDLECGRSILATGNGRCNFANEQLDLERYNDPAFVGAVCGPRFLDDVLDFFRDSGLRWCSEDGRLYPASRQAASVRNVLLARARRAGVVLAPAREFCDVTWIRPEWIGSSDHTMAYTPETSSTLPEGIAELSHTMPGGGPMLLPGSRAVVLASGGEPLPFIANLGLRLSARTPVLCPVACEPSPVFALDGRRAHVEANLTKKGGERPVWSERGEVLFRSYGISGIVTFDLSRRVAKGDLIELDLAPDIEADELMTLVDPLGTGDFEAGRLDGVIDPDIALILERLAREGWEAGWPGRVAPARRADALVRLVKALPLVVEGLAETDRAQVMRGGLANDQFDPVTLASVNHPWLYACGEALDVDADCGGFNLAWAWKSGMVAGRAAARWARS